VVVVLGLVLVLVLVLVLGDLAHYFVQCVFVPELEELETEPVPVPVE
jgi:hypothetical protein